MSRVAQEARTAIHFGYNITVKFKHRKINLFYRNVVFTVL